MCSELVSEGWKIDLGQPTREDLVTLVTKLLFILCYREIGMCWTIDISIQCLWLCYLLL